jgi:hypothetical protein
MNRRTVFRLLFLLVACASVAAQARVYRWVDEDGVTVYSQTPPPTGEATTVRTDAGPNAEETAAARERLRRQIEQDFDANQEARQLRQTKVEEAAEAEQHRLEEGNCEAARHNLNALANLGARMVRTPDGEYTRLSENEVQRLMQQARDQIKELCD